MKPAVKFNCDPLRSSALFERRLIVPAGASASMSALRVLFTSMVSMLLIDTASNSNCRVSPPNPPVLALAIEPPSSVTAP
jgi:hypothetical protein